MPAFKNTTVAALFVALTLFAQTTDRPLAPALKPYIGCHIGGGPDVVEVTPLPSTNMTRSVDTRTGSRQIHMLDGVRVMFAYPDTQFFANLKAEELPAATYEQEKTDLIANFDHMLASGDNSRNYALKPTLQGFEISGLDRGKLEGGVLGVYLLFDKPTHIVTTIYFLNADADQRKFSSLTEYATLRDKFLANYTSCVRVAQSSKR